MPTSSSTERSTSQSWKALISRLLDDHAVLVEDFLHRLEESGTYRGHDVPPSDLRRAASDTLELLIRRLAGMPIPPELAALPTELGIRRARQGIARESLMDAVRLDFRVLWGGLVRAGGEGASGLLVHYAEDVLSTVEQYIGDVQSAFLDEQAALASDTRAAVSRVLHRLLHSAVDDRDAVVIEAAARLHVRVDVELEVVHVPASHAEQAGRITRSTYGESQCASVELDDGTVFVRPLGSTPPLATALSSVAGGITPVVDGLDRLPSAVSLARRIAQHAPEGRLVREEDVWLAIVQGAVIDSLPSVAAIARGIDALPATDRDRILDTVIRYCTTGSIKETAADLFCHRNTVVNRLHQFGDATGCDVTVPLQAAKALIALGASTL